METESLVQIVYPSINFLPSSSSGSEGRWTVKTPRICSFSDPFMTKIVLIGRFRDIFVGRTWPKEGTLTVVTESRSLSLGIRSAWEIRCSSNTNSGNVTHAWPRPRLKDIWLARRAVKVIWLRFAKASWFSLTADTTSADRRLEDDDLVAIPASHESRIVTVSILSTNRSPSNWARKGFNV